MAIVHPSIDPVAFRIIGENGWPVHWYGISYLAAFMAFLFLGRWHARRRPELGFAPIQVEDILFYGVLGVVIGGRLGYVLFYQFSSFMAEPLNILKVWQGGMSFHGGLIGVIVAMAIYARKRNIQFWQLTDFVAPLVPLGLAFGRMGNFVNGELWGRVSASHYPWLMYYPTAEQYDALYATQHPAAASLLHDIGGILLLPRHPSQIYQMLGEGLLLFIILWWFSGRPRPRAAVSGLFLLGYGVLRALAEFGREPDYHLGLFSGVSMGQILCIPMMIAGGWLLWRARGDRANLA